MKNLYTCVAVVAVLISVVTVVEGIYLKDRWGKPGIEAAELGKRFAEVPKKIGNWVGTDMPVEKEVQQVSGAVNFVSRSYTNEVTNENVVLWLIVGHARDIIRHTPDICYPSAGFRPQSSKLKHTVDYGDGQNGQFYTSKYLKEDATSRQSVRVYWAWNHPDMKKWEAPSNPRYHFGMITRALYKVYFSSSMTTEEKTIEDNIAAKFAELMLPEIDKALFPTGVTTAESVPPAGESEEDPDPLFSEEPSDE